MNPTPHRRWDFRVLAARWIHVLWLLPLLGLTTGIGVHFSKFSNIGSCVIQLRQESHIPALGLRAAPDDEALHAALSSPELLGSVVSKLGLASRWRIGRNDGIDRLRGMIYSHRIKDTALIELTVLDRKSRDSVAICHAVLEEFQSTALRETEDRYSLELAWAKAAVFHQKDFVDLKREEVSSLLHYGGKGDFSTAITAFKEAQRTLEKLTIHEITLEMLNRAREEPVLVHKWPSATLAPSMEGEWIRSLLTYAALGLIAGATLAISSIYFFERLFPHPKTAPPA